MRKNILLSFIIAVFACSSCVGDLDLDPIDPSAVQDGNLYDDPNYSASLLGKVYASFIINGQGPQGGADIVVPDADFFTTMRAMWNLQEITTDEAMCAWPDPGIADLNTLSWTPQNQFLTALFQRLTLSVGYANNFISKFGSSEDESIKRYVAEVRFLRALAYYYQLDLFGSAPFITEKDEVGKFFPKQIQRQELFDYVESELLAIEEGLGEPGFSYPQADKGACWMLLGKLYLNAEVYTGTARWADCERYMSKVIDSPAYQLAPNYRQNFCADNGYDQNKEMIFSWAQDGINTQGYVGSTFLIESCSDATYIKAEDYHGLTSNTNWNGNRARRDFMNILVDTLATYNGNPIDVEDLEFEQAADSRVFLKMKKSLDIPSPASSGDYGIGVYKFTALNYDGSEPQNYHAAYACTDWPVFRFADALLMRAEAKYMQNGSGSVDFNRVRERAFGDTDHNLSDADLSLDIFSDERAREFYYEAHRRTDLIRYGKFTKSDKSSTPYLWQWKGNVFDGVEADSYRNVFPIPADELAANPNMKQNPGY